MSDHVEPLASAVFEVMRAWAGYPPTAAEPDATGGEWGHE